MHNKVIKQAAKRTEKNMRKNEYKKTLPQPRSVSEVSIERLREKEMEADAPTTGYQELDDIVGGFIPGHLYTVTGDTNTGKTSLACNFAVRVGKQDRRVLYFALEPENTVVDYLASVRTNKRFGELTDDDLQHDDGMIHIFGKDEVRTLDKMVEIIENTDTRYELVIIDHIGYFIQSGRNWLREQANSIKKLAGLAKRKQVAIMIIAHLRKKTGSKKKDYIPTSDDISGSAAFKQDSTEVMIVTRAVSDPEEGSMTYTNQGRLYVTKTKAGPNGWMELNFQNYKANIYSDSELITGAVSTPDWLDDEWADEEVEDIADALL